MIIIVITLLYSVAVAGFSLYFSNKIVMHGKYITAGCIKVNYFKFDNIFLSRFVSVDISCFIWVYILSLLFLLYEIESLVINVT